MVSPLHEDPWMCRAARVRTRQVGAFAAAMWRALLRVGLTVLIGRMCIGDGSGAVEADIFTNRGTITVELDPASAPLAVANFIGLAEGSRQWVNANNGAVEARPRYAGEPFHETVATATDERALMGVAAFEDGGFCFRDEFSATARHDPYVIAMDNVGPNSNGCSWYLTGSIPQPERDDRHVVFGQVLPGASRTIVDEVIGHRPETTVVSTVQIRRTGPEGSDFDETTVELPMVMTAAAPIRLTAGSVELEGSQPAASILSSTRSEDLAVWSRSFRRMRGRNDPTLGEWTPIDLVSSKSAFYQPSLTVYPWGDLSSTLAGKTLTIRGAGIGTLNYHFDGTGLAGTYENVLLPGEPPFFAGAFVVRTDMEYCMGPISFRMMIEATGLGGSPFNLIRGGIDGASDGALVGRHRTDLMSTATTVVFADEGSLELTGD